MFTTLLFQVTTTHSSLNALNKFPSITSCIIHLSVLDHTTSKEHHILDHTASIRNTTRIKRFILDHITRIKHPTVGYKDHFSSHQNLYIYKSHAFGNITEIVFLKVSMEHTKIYEYIRNSFCFLKHFTKEPPHR